MPIPYAGTRLPATFDRCVVGVMTRPIAPRVHCFDGDSDDRDFDEPDVPSKKGLSSSASARGSDRPSHSQSQQRRLISSSVHVLLRPAAAVRVWLFSTLGTTPFSDGETAEVASACDSAWCKEFWMLWKRARDSGKGVVVFGFLGVANGVVGL